MILDDQQKVMFRCVLIVIAAVVAGFLAKNNYEWHQNESDEEYRLVLELK